jgi:hypothetical protein
MTDHYDDYDDWVDPVEAREATEAVMRAGYPAVDFSVAGIAFKDWLAGTVRSPAQLEAEVWGDA